uniref:Uncharacterized protein n=1 Tax=Ditylenchus dipsaci TaxID=166011 RepID=A0A915D512_9BILA
MLLAEPAVLPEVVYESTALFTSRDDDGTALMPLHFAKILVKLSVLGLAMFVIRVFKHNAYAIVWNSPFCNGQCPVGEQMLYRSHNGQHNDQVLLTEKEFGKGCWMDIRLTVARNKV